MELLVAYLDHPRRLFGDLYHCAKFGWNRFSSLDNMKVSIFYAFGLKTPIHGPRIEILGAFDPLNGNDVIATPKRHFLGWKHVTGHIDRQNPSTYACWARVEV